MPRSPMAPGAYGHIHLSELPATQRGDKRWRARTRVRDEDGVTRQVSAVGGSKTKAEQALKKALVERSTPQASPLDAGSRYEVAARLWLEDIKARRARTTYDTYRSILQGVVLPRFGKLTLREVTAPRVAQTLASLGTHYTPNGVRQIKKVISGPLALAARWHVIPRNPVRDLDSIEGSSRPSRALTVAERRALLDFLDTDDKAKRNHAGDLVRFLMGTGCRISEALGLRWRDVDLEHATAHISGALVRVRGQGLVRTEGKTRTANRTLHLPPFVVMMLRLRWDERDMDLDRPVFSSATGGYRDVNNIQRIVRYVRDSVPGLEWVTTHTFRRTAATLLDEAGFSPRDVANQLGHARPSMSQDVYMARPGVGPARAAAALDLASRDESVT